MERTVRGMDGRTDGRRERDGGKNEWMDGRDTGMNVTVI